MAILRLQKKITVDHRKVSKMITTCSKHVCALCSDLCATCNSRDLTSAIPFTHRAHVCDLLINGKEWSQECRSAGSLTHQW